MGQKAIIITEADKISTKSGDLIWANKQSSWVVQWYYKNP